MIVENINGMTVLHSEENNKITNSKNDYYSDFIFLPSNYNLEDNPQGIRAVGYGIWGQFLEEEIPQNKFDILQEKISDNNLMITNLEELLLDTDFRLMCLEIEKEYKEM